MRPQRNNDQHPFSRISRGVTNLVGIASEVRAQSKSKKSGNQDTENRTEDTSITTFQNEIPRGNVLDEYHAPATESVDYPVSIQALPFPVILPQRRPNSKSRGFVRGYAPDLGQYKGISQQTFLDFLEDFQKSSQASPVFQVINVAAMAAGFAPSITAQIVSVAVTAASTVAMEYHGRYRTNNFLDKANEELFHPKNLHCLIMTFKPQEQESAVLNFNFNNGLFSDASALFKKFSQSRDSSSGQEGGRFRKSDGVTKSELEIPQAASLVFPDSQPDDGAAEGSESGELESTQKKTPSMWKTTSKSISDYKDRRAQAEFISKHGSDSQLASFGASEPNFASKYSDPNHPVNSGSPLALLTGGKYQNVGDIGAKLGPSLGLQRSFDSQNRSAPMSQSMMGRGRGNGPNILQSVKSIAKQDVLYMMIAEMPSQEQMVELAGQMEI